MPPSGFGKKAVKGLLAFVKANYEDLQKEIRSGKHPNLETAVTHEIDQLGKALLQLHINKHGRLVKRPKKSP